MLSWEDLEAVRGNWLVGHLAVEDFKTARAAADERVMFSALPGVFDAGDTGQSERRIRKAVVAYQIAAAESLPVVSPTNIEESDAERISRASAYLAYDLLRSLPMERTGDVAMIDVLTRCALAYIGDRGVDLRPLLDEADTIRPQRFTWDAEVFARLFRCWLTIFGNSGHLSDVADAVAALRSEQETREPDYLASDDVAMPADQRAIRLYALYNWARGTELLASYLKNGFEDQNVDTGLDVFFEDAQKWAALAGHGGLAAMLRWVRVAAHRMVRLSVWNEARSDAAMRFLRRLASRENRPLLEFLPPQLAALREHHVMDQGRSAVVVDMPTSSGKTLLAELRIVQTLLAYRDGWVAYVVPTRALGAQIVRRLRRDLGEEYRIESLSAAVDLDSLEEQLLSDEAQFHVLVCTPEKLNSLIRGKRVKRTLRLAVVDEAQGIENGKRGLILELLLATLRSETPADFMLLMPYVPNGKELGQWLSRDNRSFANASLSAAPWKPNDVLVGTFSVEGQGERWRMLFEPKLTKRGLDIKATLPVRKVAPLRGYTASGVNKGVAAGAAMAVAFDNPDRGVNMVMCQTIPHAWTVAETIRANLRKPVRESAAVELVRRFVRTEVSTDFVLDSLLGHGIGVHHAGLPEDVRTSVEWLIEERQLRAVCATSTIAQGMDLAVGSIFITSLMSYDEDLHRSKPYTAREFWNLAGRAGRFGQSAVGVVGVFRRDGSAELDEILGDTGKSLVSQLERLFEALEESGLDKALTRVSFSDDWTDFRTFLSHLVSRYGATSHEIERVVRNTLGYRRLEAAEGGARKARALLDVTQQYVKTINPQRASQADKTGFDPKAIGAVIQDLSTFNLGASDWVPERLFSGESSAVLSRLVGAMMKIPQIARALKDFGGSGNMHERIANISAAWVSGARIGEIADRFFSEKKGKPVTPTMAVSDACKALYRSLSFAAPWAMSGMMQLPTSGLDFDSMDDAERRRLNLIPAFLYHGVRTEAAVAMRINGVPRSVAEHLGARFRDEVGANGVRIGTGRSWLAGLSSADWERSRPQGAALSGADYRTLWREVLSPGQINGA